MTTRVRAGCSRSRVVGVWHLLSDPRSRDAVEAARRYADGIATHQQLVAAAHAAEAAHREAFPAKGKIGASAEWAAEFAASTDAWFAATRASSFAYVAVGGELALSGPERAAQADLLRCILGPLPFAPEDAEATARAPIDGPITSMAQTIYDSGAFDR